MYPIRILVTLVALVGIGAAFVISVMLSGKADVNTIPLIVTVLGFIGLIVNNLATGKALADKVDDASAKVDRVLNGEMDAKIRKNVRAVLEEILTPHLDDNS